MNDSVDSAVLGAENGVAVQHDGEDKVTTSSKKVTVKETKVKATTKSTTRKKTSTSKSKAESKNTDAAKESGIVAGSSGGDAVKADSLFTDVKVAEQTENSDSIGATVKKARTRKVSKSKAQADLTKTNEEVEQALKNKSENENNGIDATIESSASTKKVVKKTSTVRSASTAKGKKVEASTTSESADAPNELNQASALSKPKRRTAVSKKAEDSDRGGAIEPKVKVTKGQATKKSKVKSAVSADNTSSKAAVSDEGSMAKSNTVAKYSIPSEYKSRTAVQDLDDILNSMLNISTGKKKNIAQAKRSEASASNQGDKVSNDELESSNSKESTLLSQEKTFKSFDNLENAVQLVSGTSVSLVSVIKDAIAITPLYLGDQMVNCRIGLEAEVRLLDLKAVFGKSSRFMINLIGKIKFAVNVADRKKISEEVITNTVYRMLKQHELSVYRMSSFLVFAPKTDMVELEGSVALAYTEEKILDRVSRTFTTEFVPDAKYNEEIAEKNIKHKKEEPEYADHYRLYVPNNSVFHGDIVKVLLNTQANIAYYMETIREHNLVLGRIVRTSAGYALNPDDVRLSNICYVFGQEGDIGEAAMGAVVICQILQRNSRCLVYKVRVVEILGDFERLDIQIKMGISRSGLPYEWNDRVRKQVAKIADEVLEKDKKNRVDLRDLPLVTIDGEDARDFDDAVCCKKEGSGFRLYVAIADVSYYVRTGTPLDAEARHRGNSVYFPNYVVPMLPEKLSNGLCSLNPLVDRLCMVCEAYVGSDGTIGDYSFYPAVMNSHARFTYTEVASILAGNKPSNSDYVPLVPALNNLYGLYKALKQARANRGAIEFESEEVRFVFDENLNIADILPVIRNDAHMLIEECMIVANVCAAKFVEEHKGETLFRVHARPSETKLQAFRAFLAPLGLSLGGGDTPTSADYAEFVRSIGDNPNKNTILIMMLRSMSLAEYTPDNGGHFGLSLGQYAHFTSPIRRYPDLQLHREIKYILGRIGVAGDKKVSPKNMDSMGAKEYGYEELETLGENCNMTERRADKVTGEVESALKARFISQFQGMKLPGVVTNITNFGLFVTIERFNITGLVHVSALPNDYFNFDSTTCSLVGENTGTTFKLGDHVTVIVDTVEIESGHIGFKLAVESKKVGHKARSNANGEKKVATALDDYEGGIAVDNQEINTLIRTSMARWENISQAENGIGILGVKDSKELESFVPKNSAKKKNTVSKTDKKASSKSEKKKSNKKSGKEPGSSSGKEKKSKKTKQDTAENKESKKRRNKKKANAKSRSKVDGE